MAVGVVVAVGVAVAVAVGAAAIHLTVPAQRSHACHYHCSRGCPPPPTTPPNTSAEPFALFLLLLLLLFVWPVTPPLSQQRGKYPQVFKELVEGSPEGEEEAAQYVGLSAEIIDMNDEGDLVAHFQ